MKVLSPEAVCSAKPFAVETATLSRPSGPLTGAADQSAVAGGDDSGLLQAASPSTRAEPTTTAVRSPSRRKCTRPMIGVAASRSRHAAGQYDRQGQAPSPASPRAAASQANRWPRPGSRGRAALAVACGPRLSRLGQHRPSTDCRRAAGQVLPSDGGAVLGAAVQVRAIGFGLLIGWRRPADELNLGEGGSCSVSGEAVGGLRLPRDQPCGPTGSTPCWD